MVRFCEMWVLAEKDGRPTFPVRRPQLRRYEFLTDSCDAATRNRVGIFDQRGGHGEAMEEDPGGLSRLHSRRQRLGIIFRNNLCSALHRALWDSCSGAIIAARPILTSLGPVFSHETGLIFLPVAATRCKPLCCGGGYAEPGSIALHCRDGPKRTGGRGCDPLRLQIDQRL